MAEPRARSIVGTLFRVASARLRFVAVFGVVFAVIGGWETIRTHWDRWTAGKSAEQVTSSDTDFFCPMDPGVLSDWPSKCPVCNMTLVRRKRGDAAPLPSGVVARMQFSPDRLWLGGIRTATVDYAPLARIVEIPGTVTTGGVEAEVFAGERSWLAVGQEAEVSSLIDPSRPPLKSRIHSIDGEIARLVEGSTGGVTLDSGAFSGWPGRRTRAPERSEPTVSRPGHGYVAPATQTGPPGGTNLQNRELPPSMGLGPGERVRIAVRCPIDRIEPFRSLPSIPPPLIKGEPRSLFVCMDHPDVIQDTPGRCPRDRSELMARPVRENQRSAGGARCIRPSPPNDRGQPVPTAAG